MYSYRLAVISAEETAEETPEETPEETAEAVNYEYALAPISQSPVFIAIRLI